MSNKSHLTDDVLLLVTMRELPKIARQPTADHLDQCAACRERLRGFLDTRSNVQQLGEQELRALASENWEQEPQSKGSVSKVVRITGTVLASLVLAVAGYLSIMKPRPVSADELLTRATAHQSQITGPKRYNLRMGKTNCIGGTTIRNSDLVKNPTPCTILHRTLIDGRWNPERPMAAESFQSWRRSLTDRRDIVTQSEETWNLRTETGSGKLRAASIRIRKSDYEPQEVTLEYIGLEPILIEEAPLPEVPVLVANLEAKNLKLVKTSPEAAPDPSDVREVHAWATLHQVGADSGWEAVVIRQADRVMVGGLVADAARQQEIDSAIAQADPQIEVNLHTYTAALPSDRALFPERKLGASAPPLAEDWLEQHFPAPNERSAYSSHVSELSRSLLGQIFLYSRLIERSQALHNCQCARDLEPILLAQRERIGSLQQELASALAPLTNEMPAQKSGRLLTYREAVELDKLVRNTFTAQSESSMTLSEALDGLRSRLSKS
jgi:hypothetical protein